MPADGVAKPSPDTFSQPQVSACYILGIEDDLVNEGGIFDGVMREARIFKGGSGSGANFSKLRAAGEKLTGGGTSSGLMSFLKVFDRAAGAIKSGGTTRRAAKMVVLNADHPDIEEFVNWKVREERKVADLVIGSRIFEKHLNAIISAAHDTRVPDHARLDPALNASLREAIREAIAAGIPSGAAQNALDYARQGYTRLEVEQYDTGLGFGGVRYRFGAELQQLGASDATPSSTRSIATQDWLLTARTTGDVVKRDQSPRPLGADRPRRLAVRRSRACSSTTRFKSGTRARTTNASTQQIRASPAIRSLRRPTARRASPISSARPPSSSARDGKPHFVSKIFPTGTKPVYRLRTKAGYELKLTADHKVWTENRGDVAAADLRSGDRIALGGSGFGSVSLDERIALGIGAAVGDGCVAAASNGTGRDLTITMHEDEAGILEDIASGINEVKATFADDGGSRRPTTVTMPPKGTGSRISTGNHRIVELFSRYAVLDRGSEKKALTDAVYTLDREATATLLRGIFTADGTVANYGAKSQYVSLDSCSLELLQASSASSSFVRHKVEVVRQSTK